MPFSAAAYGRYRWPTARFTVAHAPTARFYKGTAAVIRACAQADLPLDLIENIAHEDALTRKGRCRVLIDQILDEYNPDPSRIAGYGVNGLEAIAMGIPVIGQAARATAEAIKQLDAQPIIFADEWTLADKVSWLADDDISPGACSRGAHLLACLSRSRAASPKDGCHL